MGRWFIYAWKQGWEAQQSNMYDDYMIWFFYSFSLPHPRSVCVLWGWEHRGRLPERNGGSGSAAALRRPQPSHLRAETGHKDDRRFHSYNTFTGHVLMNQGLKSERLIWHPYYHTARIIVGLSWHHHHKANPCPTLWMQFLKRSSRKRANNGRELNKLSSFYVF